jgi:hypothetical protein
VETGHALRETSDALMRDLEVLTALEQEKRGLEPGDPKLVDLAGRIQEIANRVLAGSVREHQLTQSGNVLIATGSDHAPSATIEETPRVAAEILAEWREAERRIADAEPGTAEAAEAQALADALREEYQRAYDQASRRG